ncbi:hypothetical protein C7N43_20205 [Sphingobacteriales bacterium UPWRP_1]|nr:hypothetical protein B6N25_01870 [Sphingobacteriales bacterium TSM_CSS]PSJ75198.1 hypothetical protein C7N43_20205 [Sphingobacteriales bacterium UPWRP_1]
MAGSPACLYFYCYIAEQEFVAAKSSGLLRQTGSVLCNSSLGCLAFKTLPSTFYLHIRNVFYYARNTPKLLYENSYQRRQLISW